MNTFKKMTMILSLMAFCSFPAFGDESPRRGHHTPPPEAYTACEGKNAGDEAEFITPHGATVTGICEIKGERLVLRPDNPPPRPPRQGNEN